MSKPEWEDAFDEAWAEVCEEFKAGLYIQENTLQASLYHHLREKLQEHHLASYTVIPELKYSWHQRPSHKEGYNFDLAILKGWNPYEEAKIKTDSGARDYRYRCTVGLVELKMAKTHMWGRSASNKGQWVKQREWKKDLEKFSKLWRHPSRLMDSVECAYLCLFDDGPPPGNDGRLGYKDPSGGKIKIKSCTKTANSGK
jgi:hypothetical protein